LSASPVPLPEPVFQVREIPVYGDLILSPMDGYSDQPFRAVCRGLGSAMSYTEFINAIDVVGYHPHLQRKLAFQPDERPVVYQLFDDDVERLLKAALKLEQLGSDIIDVNMGCSARCVSGRGAGAGLLRQPEKVALIFQQLVHALKVPVTAKIRLGWDDDSRNYRLIARIVEENGGSLIAVHGRTRSQAYKGQADWDAIAEVRQTVSIPVVANGDVRTVADIERIKAQTGCAAVMIGRAAVGNPWIFSRLDRGQAPLELVLETMQRHLQSMLAFYGQETGLLRFRKHADRYLEPYGLAPGLRHALLTAENPDEFCNLLAGVAA
jgi:tRNA-dihydrouridine synthase B